MTTPSPSIAHAEFAAPFFGAAATLLGALLLTWLATEVRVLRERRDDDPGAAARVSHASMVPIVLALTGGILVALRVLSRQKAADWETIAVWSALGLGLGTAAISLLLALRAHGRLGGGPRDRRPRWSWLRSGVSLAVAVAAGLVASPLVRGDDDPRDRVQIVGARFAVYGTCLRGGCKLKQRTGPGPRHPESPLLPRLPDGTMVRVVCQTAAPPAPGYRSNVWDRLDNGAYVSDAFVDTPNRAGRYSEGLPRC